MMKRLQINNLSEKGQALVESAFIVPVLAFMLIGMIEVGWALRGYLTLANINREVTRRAVKADFLDFSTRTGSWTADTESTHYYSNVLDPYFSFGGAEFANNFPLPQLLEAFKSPANLTDDPAAYLTLTYFVVNTGAPCKRNDDGTLINCSCQEFKDAFDSTSPGQAKTDYYAIKSNFIYDDIILHPGVGLNFKYFFYTYPPDESKIEGEDFKRYTRLPEQFGSYENFVYYKALENAAFNCKLLEKNPGLEPSNNNIMYGELYYRQPQLLGFPIYSAIGGVPMYTQTSFRLMASVRNRIDPKTTGPLCALLPFFGDRGSVGRVLRRAIADGAYDSAKDRIQDTAINNYAPINLIDGNRIVWLNWGSGNDVDFIKYRIQYPQMVLNERLKKGSIPNGEKEPRIGLSGVAYSTNQDYINDLAELQTLLESYVGQEVIVPVGGFKGAPIVIIQPGGVDLANKQIMARVVGLAKSECFDSVATNSDW